MVLSIMKYLQRSAAFAASAALISSAALGSATLNRSAVASSTVSGALMNKGLTSSLNSAQSVDIEQIAWANDGALPGALPGEPTDLGQPNDPNGVQVTPEVDDAAKLANHLNDVRDTNSCPYTETPPPAVDSSEVPTPGQPTPQPLPVQSPPAGGSKMSECGIVKAEDFHVPDTVTGSGWIVFDIDTGEVIAAKDPHGRYRPASVIKVLLALVAIDQLKLDQRFEATFEDASIEGSRAGLVEGNEYTVKLLLQALLMSSGNDAANVLIRAIGGEEKAVEKINAKAKSLGATDTRVVNPSGLDGPGQMTSPFDLALFYREAFQNETFVKLDSTRLVTMPGNEEQGLPDFEMGNDNNLFANDYPGTIGGKTGFTDDARHTFVGAADQGGRRLGAALVDATIANGFRAWAQTADLMTAGFASRAEAVGDLNDLPNLDADGNSGSNDDGNKISTNVNSFFASLNMWQRIGVGAGIALVVIVLVAITFRAGRRR